MHRISLITLIGTAAVVCALALLVALSSSEAAAFGPAISPHVATAHSDPTVRLETTPIQGNIGDVFTTRIYADNIANAPGLGNWQSSINYNVAILSVDSVTFGAGLGSTGRGVGNVGPTFSSGKVTLGQFSFGPQNGPIGSSIDLATIVWRGVGNGVSNLDLNTSRLLDINATLLTPLIEIDSSIVVGDTPAQKYLWLPVVLHGNGNR